MTATALTAHRSFSKLVCRSHTWSTSSFTKFATPGSDGKAGPARSDEHCERDAETFVREFWGIRRAENDFEKLIVTLSEIGAPSAAAAGDFEAMAFYLGELRIAGHPAADKLEKQCAELSHRRVDPITPRKIATVANSPTTSDDQRLQEIKDHYHNIIGPRRAAAYIKPHLRPFQKWEYSIGGIAR